MPEILYRSSAAVVCVKPVGVNSQGESATDLPALLAAQLGVEEVYPVHRLDRVVGGVMVFALTKKAAAALSAAVQNGGLQKEYLAVLSGRPENETDTLTDLLFHDRTRNKTYVVKRQRAGVKQAILDYRLLSAIEDADGTRSLVRVLLHTGRTHQIRVQFASRRLPLVGDGKYGSKSNRCETALWSYQISFPDPESGKAVSCRSLPPMEYPWTLFERNLP